jgi:hypothetical protein
MPVIHATTRLQTIPAAAIKEASMLLTFFILKKNRSMQLQVCF